ncbi:MAG: hypothetical protein ACPGU7_14075 [Gammaproteobacteria bacterium]
MDYECTWLKKPLEDRTLLQKQLEPVLGVAAKQVGYLVNCKQRLKPEEGKLQALADFFAAHDVPVDGPEREKRRDDLYATLRRDWRRDWAATHPDEVAALKPVDQDRLTTELTVLDCAALNAQFCHAYKQPEIGQCVDALAEDIAQGREGFVCGLILKALNEMRASATTKDRHALRRMLPFAGYIATLFARDVHGVGRETPQRRVSHPVVGTNDAFIITLAMDNSLNARRHRDVEIENGKPSAGTQWTGVIDVVDFGPASELEWAHGVVATLGDYVFADMQPDPEATGGARRIPAPGTGQCPAFDRAFSRSGERTEEFKAYLRRVDARLILAMSSGEYFVVRSDTEVPALVIGYLEDWLPGLHCFHVDHEDVRFSSLVQGNPDLWAEWLGEVDEKVTRILERLDREGPAPLKPDDEGPSQDEGGPTAVGPGGGGPEAPGSGPSMGERLGKLWNTGKGFLKDASDAKKHLKNLGLGDDSDDKGDD